MENICYLDADTVLQQNHFEILQYPSAARLTPKQRADYVNGIREKAEMYYLMGELAFAEAERELALEWYEAAAAGGVAKAQRMLGDYYSLYYGGNDCTKAKYWYQRAAEKNDAEAQYQRGQDYELSNLERYQWYQKAAEQGHPMAQYCLGECFYYGHGVCEDKEKALHWYRAAAKNGNTKAQWELVDKRYTFELSKEEVSKWCLEAAERGYLRAQYDASLYVLPENDTLAVQMRTEEKCQSFRECALEQLDKWCSTYTKTAEWCIIWPGADIEEVHAIISEYRNCKDRELMEVFLIGVERLKLYDYEASVECFQKALEKEKSFSSWDADWKIICHAKTGLAYCLFHGYGIEQDKKRAGDLYWDVVEDERYASSVAPNGRIEALKKAGEWGFAEEEIACCYALGYGTAKDLKMAEYWYEKAAKQGSISAVRERGRCHALMNDAPYFTYYEKAANAGDAEACVLLGECLEAALDKDKAMSYYRKAAEAGNVQGQRNMARCLEQFVLEQDMPAMKKETVHWYQKAAAQWDAYSMLHLGFCYAQGYGIEKDDAQAAVYFRRAAWQQNAEACYQLGLCCEDGRGIKKDDEQAEIWYQKAEKLGNEDALVRLADRSYQLAKQTTETSEYEKAVRYYDRIMYKRTLTQEEQRGYADCCYRLGYYADAKTAYICIQDKTSEDIFRLGRCWYLVRYQSGELQGDYAQGDYMHAMYHYQRAAEKGHVEAMYTIGICYKDGIGVKKNLREAKSWMKKAAELGHEGAKQMLKTELKGLFLLYRKV